MEFKKEWFEIKEANESIATIDVKGKEYAQVNQRIKAFRIVYPKGLIQTEIISLENGVVTMQTKVFDENGTLLGTGYAQEKESSTYINKTSYIENCETSAVGRALGMCGFGIDVSVASAEEVQNAINNQEEKPKPKSNKWSQEKRKEIVARVNSNKEGKAYAYAQELLKVKAFNFKNCDDSYFDELQKLLYEDATQTGEFAEPVKEMY